MKEAGFEVLDFGLYFVKPFSHEQMQKLMNKDIITRQVLDGFDKLVKYMPNYGSEIFVNCIVERDAF